MKLSNYRPRFGVTVIPPGWEQHHKPTADGGRTAIVEVWSGPLDGAPEWVYMDGREIRDHGILLHGDLTARIQRLGQASEVATGAQDVTVRTYLVALDREVGGDFTPRARVKVIDSGDPQIDGRYMSVLDIYGGSLRFERDLICLDNLDPHPIPDLG